MKEGIHQFSLTRFFFTFFSFGSQSGPEVFPTSVKAALLNFTSFVCHLHLRNFFIATFPGGGVLTTTPLLPFKNID
jgi:hypothetical protein